MATGFDFASLGNLFAPGGTPSGLDALFNEDQRRLMGRNANLSAAAALLQASGRSRERIGLGQALGSALQAGQQGYQQARAGSLQDLMLAEKMKEAQQARQIQQQVAGALTTAPSVLSPMQQALAAPGQLGSTTERADMMAAMPEMTPNQIKANQYQNAADILAAAGRVADAEKYQSMAEKLNPREEVTGQPFEVSDASGQPLLVQQMKSGKLQTLQGFGPKREVVLQNLGGRTVAVNKAGLKGGESFEMTMTPSETASNIIAQGNLGVAQGQLGVSQGNLAVSQGQLGVARGGLGLRQQEFNRGAFDRVETPDGFVYVPKVPGGAAVPITGPGGQPLKGVSGGNASEGERKAGSLLARLNLAESQMTGEGASGVPGFFTSVSPRVALPEGRKRVEDAQLDFLDAALTLSTGAAYTEAQLKGAQQSYFPKFGDSPATIAEKEVRRKNLAEAGRLAAGRMAPAVDALQRQPTASGGSGQRRSLNNIFGVPK